MLIIKREIESDYIFKYIDRQGTKNLTLWKYFLKKGNLSVYDVNGVESRAVELSDMKTIKEIKKVMDSYPFKWEFQISPKSSGEGYMLQGFNFILPETEITNSQFPDEKAVKKNLIIFCSLNLLKLGSDNSEIRISQSSILTNIFENHMVQKSVENFVVHPHISTMVSKASCKDSKDSYDFINQMTDFVEGSGYFRRRPDTNICLGAGDAGNTIRGIFFADQEEFPITVYIEALLTVCEQESEEGVPYSNIRNLITVSEYIENLRTTSGIPTLQNALGIRRLILNGQYCSESFIESVIDFVINIEDEISENIETLKKLDFEFYLERPPEFVSSTRLEDLIEQRFLELPEDERKTIMSTKILQQTVGLGRVSKIEVEKYIDFLKNLLSDIKRYDKKYSLTKKVTFEDFYFKFEGEEHFFEKNVVNRDLSFLSKEDEIVRKIEFYEQLVRYSIPKEIIIKELKNKVNERIEKNTKKMVEQSFIARAKSSLESREKCLFKD